MPLQGKKILVTSGPTWVAIDDTRVISNISTGELGRRLARHLQTHGARVTLLEGPVALSAGDKGITLKKFRYFEELKHLLESEAKRSYAAIIHAAAVSDYRVQRPAGRKISSGRAQWDLTLIPTPKIIDRIKTWAPAALLIGFKLESSVDEAAALRHASALHRRAACDLVLVNSVAEGYRGFLVDPRTGTLRRIRSRLEAVRGLTNLLKEKL